MFEFRNANRCRNCKHPHYWEIITGRIRECTIKKCFCNAEDWVPLDNLEFIEGLYNKKKKV